MKIVLLLVGLIAIVLGAYWIVEGFGLVAANAIPAIPHIPVVYGDKMWAYYGIGCAVLGLLVIGYSRRA